ncbi:alpha/beta fold hydrolase [Cytophagia bacterium]|nr:alpha/beta fold hydrolase [Cytophagia bacterium]
MTRNLNFKEFGSGKQIIILHGLLGSLDNWVSIALKLSQNYKVTILDLPNHGRSYHSNTFSYYDMATSLNEFIKTKNINDPTIIGHSMGGKLAMQYVELFPKIVSSLVIVDVCNRVYDITRFNHVFEAIKKISSENVQSRKQASELIKEIVNSEGERNFILKNLKRDENGFSWTPNVNLLMNSISEISAAVEVKNIDIKTLFIKGQKSSYILDSDIAELKKTFSNFSIIEIPNAGHWVHAESPSHFVTSVKEWI